jgi:hypothetical protein
MPVSPSLHPSPLSSAAVRLAGCAAAYARNGMHAPARRTMAEAWKMAVQADDLATRAAVASIAALANLDGVLP